MLPSFDVGRIRLALLSLLVATLAMAVPGLAFNSGLLVGPDPVKPGLALSLAPLVDPDPQYPFACTVQDHGLGQPLVDNEEGLGIAVVSSTGDTIGYSRDCKAETRHWFYAFGDDGRGYVIRGPEDARPVTLEEVEAHLDAQGTVLAYIEPEDVSARWANGRFDGGPIPYLVRHERGVINRFIYGISTLVDVSTLESGSPEGTDGTIWNGRLLYQFDGGVGIGHTQGRFSDGAPSSLEPETTGGRARAIQGYPDRLARGYAVVYSTGTRTGDHYNLLVGGRTAVAVKDRFVERFGEPRYTIGLGGSGGGIQQYVYQQNHPELLDAAIPQLSYPDMSTQTVHVGDCNLLERYMDVDAADDPTWQNWDNRRWLLGLNTIEGYLGSTARALTQAQEILGLPVQTGSSECQEGWPGLPAATLNPTFGSERNWELLGDQINGIERTHWNDAVEAYGRNPETGFARVPWDNVGVQYGLRSLVAGRISLEQFLDVNARVGGWVASPDMVPEAAPYAGLSGDRFDTGNPADLMAVLTGRLDWDPWSARNMTLSQDDGVTPAPRTEGDLEAIRAAYESGLVFLGAPPREIPVIEARHHLEHVLDMHNSHQSFAVEARLLAHQGHADNHSIWWLETDEQGQSPWLVEFYEKAFDVLEEWMSRLEADPTLSVGAARPERATPRCYGVDGSLLAAGDDVWEGAMDPDPRGACARHFEIRSTSRIEAGGPISGDVYKCHTIPVRDAVAQGMYGDVVVDEAAIQRLEAIHPQGVCDYSRPGVGDPRGSEAPSGDAGMAQGTVFHDLEGTGRRDPADPGIEGVLVSDGIDVVRTDTAGRWQLPLRTDVTYFVIQPSGWRAAADSLGFPAFYHHHAPNGLGQGKFPGIEPTGPLPASLDFALRPASEPDSFDVLVLADPQPRNPQELEFLARDLTEHLVDSEASFGVVLGDLVFDALSLFEPLNGVLGQAAIPWFPVVGNHDLNLDAPGPEASTATFRRVYGPTHYAFEYGGVLFVVLNNVWWSGERYRYRLGDPQTAFVQSLLAHIPDDRLVVVLSHAPLPSTRERDELWALLGRFDRVLALAGHWHVFGQTVMGADDGWIGAHPLHVVVPGAVSGGWWSGHHDEYGLPHALMYDGTPNGFARFTFQGGDYRFVYQALGRPRTFQLRVHAPDVVDAHAPSTVNITVNAFAASEGDRVEMRFRGHDAWTNLEPFRGSDPDVARLKAREEELVTFLQQRNVPLPPLFVDDIRTTLYDLEVRPPETIGRPVPPPEPQRLLWRGSVDLPESAGVHTLEVRWTDGFGQVHRAHHAIRRAGH